MKIKYFLAASAAALITVTSANAADIVQSAPHEPAPVATIPTFSWAGAYAGGQIGGSWSKTKLTQFDREAGQTDNQAEGWKPKASGFIGGLYAGYNFDVGHNIILGGETDFVWGSIKKNSTQIGSDYIYNITMKQKWAGATRIRVGYAMDRFMPYLAAGVAYTKINTSDRNNGTGSEAYSYYHSNNLTGWTIGTGVDYAVTDNILLRLEYRYADYGRKDTAYTVLGGGGLIERVKYKSNDVRVGVAYKF